MSNEYYDSVTSDPLTEQIGNIGVQERNGVLEVTGPETVTRLHFRKGALVHAEQVAGSDLWPLGDYLTYGGILSSRDILRARRAADKKNIPIEDALLAFEQVTEDLLARFVDLQVQESLFPLFNLESPILTWLDERPRLVRFGTPLPTEWILKESRRRADIWIGLFEAVGRKTAVFDKDHSCLAELLGYTHDREEPLPSIGGNARIVFYYINGEKTVVQLARASGLGLFQVYQALAELIDADVVEITSLNGVGERPPVFRPTLRYIVLGLTYTILALGLIVGVHWGLNHGKKIEEHLLSHYGQVTENMPTIEMQRIMSSLELYELEFGHYPASLAELTETGYSVVRPERLRDAYRLDLSSTGYKVVRHEPKE